MVGKLLIVAALAATSVSSPSPAPTSCQGALAAGATLQGVATIIVDAYALTYGNGLVCGNFSTPGSTGVGFVCNTGAAAYVYKLADGTIVFVADGTTDRVPLDRATVEAAVPAMQRWLSDHPATRPTHMQHAVSEAGVSSKWVTLDKCTP